MNKLILEDYHRFNLIRWHAKSCPDGNSQMGKPWKTELAVTASVSAALITKISKTIENSGVKGFRRETVESICLIKDEEFLGIFGFEREAKHSIDGSSESNQIQAKKFANAQSLEDYVELCIFYGVPVTEKQKSLALERREKSELRQRKIKARWRTNEDAYWKVSQKLDDSEIEKVPMHISETEGINSLFSAMTTHSDKSRTSVVHAQPHSGVAYALCRLLPECKGFRRYYSGGILNLHIGALEHPDDARNRLKEELFDGEDTQDDKFRQLSVERKIASLLFTRSQLLVIHGASAIPERAVGFIQNLSNKIESLSENQLLRGISRLVLTIWQPGDFHYLNDRNPIKFDFRPKIHPQGAIDYFNGALAHYRTVMKSNEGTYQSTNSGVENAIRKRAKHHYLGKNVSFTELPSAVRYRAFCASDTGNSSPFDPTQGIWSRVKPEWRTQVSEISDCLSDIQSDLRSYANLNLASDLATLRAVSTGLFFLSDSMLKHLKENQFSKPVMHNIGISSNLMSKYIDTMLEPDSELKKHSAPLLVRSIVQDDWMRFDQLSRSAVHLTVAEALNEMAMEHTDTDHQAEIPYAYPWGNSRVVLALETIRHYVRAAKGADSTVNLNIIRKALGVYNKFLETGVFSTSNEDIKSGAAGKLSRSYGLQSLKHEALCLLSEDGFGKKAPAGTSVIEQQIFFREIGITLTHMLRPQEAMEAFNKCLKLDTGNAYDLTYVLAHDVTAALLNGNIDRAKDSLNEARLLEKNIDHVPHRKKAQQRNDARYAMLQLVSGRRYFSRELWNEALQGGLTPYHSDRCLGLFDAELSSPVILRSQKSKADQLWALIERASHVAQDRAHEYERLRIDIRKATLARVLGYLSSAEAILDHIGFDLAKHSGAEILFREFQLESAQTLLSLHRPKYAFVAYAWPAFQSLNEGQTYPLARQSRNLCIKLLRGIELNAYEPEPNLKGSPFWAELTKGLNGNVYPLFSMGILPSIDEIELNFIGLKDDATRKEYLQILRN